MDYEYKKDDDYDMNGIKLTGLQNLKGIELWASEKSPIRETENGTISASEDSGLLSH